MNIFVPFNNIEDSVKSLDDKRVVKMVLETAQIICTVRHMKGLPAPYRVTHKSHPCVVWAMSDNNLAWLINYGIQLGQEYTFRFGKVHKSYLVIKQYEQSIQEPEQFVNCTLFKQLEVHEAYRQTLLSKWGSDKVKPKWTKRAIPFFFKVC